MGMITKTEVSTTVENINGYDENALLTFAKMLYKDGIIKTEPYYNKETGNIDTKYSIEIYLENNKFRA